MMLALFALLPLLAAPVAASALPNPHKRWNRCYGYNPDGCPFPDSGAHGAVATVSVS